MVEVEEKGKAHASGSEPENKDSTENDAYTAASDPANLNVEGQIHASGPETEKKASVDNADSEMATPEQAKLNGAVPTTTTEGEKEENKNGENKEKNKEAIQTVSTPGGSSKKRKRKKVTKPKGTASAKKANAGTTVPGQVKMDVDVPMAVVDAEEKDKKKEEGNEEQNSKEKADNTLSTTPGKSRKRKRKKATKGSAKSVPAKDTDKPETSTKQKDDKKLESMGMIFMCSSKTKQDCYRYKVFGLPATKKDEVAKIYKGMRLFLFDIDLKLMYGIYKAAEPGGYNLEPKAFNSAFPSQVRFTIVEDCLPLAEEKFKAVIKDNYYGKNKFDCKLKAEQVKNMCKLFKATSKGREAKHVGGVRKTERRVVVDRSREKLQGRDRERRQGRDRDRQQGRDRERRQGRDRERQQGRDRERREGRGRGERVAYVADPVRLRAAADVYGRELPLAYAPQRVAPQLPQPISAPLTYPFERPLDVDYYRRDVQLERPDRRFLDLGLSRREEVVYRDPHETYSRAPLAHEPPISYHESLFTRLDRDLPLSYHDSSAYGRAPPTHEPTLSYREPLYSRLAPEPPLPYHDPTYARAPARDLYRY